MYAGVPIAMPLSSRPDRQRGADGFRDAEVGDEGVCALSEDVRRLDVAMDDTALVRESERVDDIVQDTSDFARGERSLALETRRAATRPR